MTEDHADHGPAARQFFDEPTHYLRRNAVIELRRSLVGEVLREVRPRRILDVGCGDGRVSAQFLERGAEVVLVDFSESMLQAARANVPDSLSDRVTLRRLDVATDELLQLAPADVVLCVGVLAHIPDPGAAVRRVAALVEPGGRLLLQITDFDMPIGKALHWLARLGRGRHYRLSKTRASDVLAWATSSGLELAGATSYPASLPGGRRLPMAVQELLIQATTSGALTAPLRTEALLLFRRPA